MPKNEPKEVDLVKEVDPRAKDGFSPASVEGAVSPETFPIQGYDPDAAANASKDK